MYYVATRYGFMVSDTRKHCCNDVRRAFPFPSFEAADETGKKFFGEEYFAILDAFPNPGVKQEVKQPAKKSWLSFPGFCKEFIRNYKPT